jgi:hypothetical protein
MCFTGRGMFLSWVVVEYLRVDGVVFVFLVGMFAECCTLRILQHDDGHLMAETCSCD